MGYIVNSELARLEEERDRKNYWRRWGPYLSERQWATVREDISSNGDVWNGMTHDMARSFAYHWGEDGIAGISDNHQRLCFSVALWNGEDPILKERLFGLTNQEGNHGEDVKECYYYLENTPTHSYMRYLYKYPHRAFPYNQLVDTNRNRGLDQKEFELEDTGIFSDNQYFDVFIEYAKESSEDILIAITVCNRANAAKKITIIPQIWFRNTWREEPEEPKPNLQGLTKKIQAQHPNLGIRWLHYDGNPKVLFTENETNTQRLFSIPNAVPYVKDAFHQFIIEKKLNAVSPEMKGTKAGLVHEITLASLDSKTIFFRLSDQEELAMPLGHNAHTIAAKRKECEQFFRDLAPKAINQEQFEIQLQAYGGLLWNKQYYHFVVDHWLKHHPGQTRNADWLHLYNDDVLSLPDKWEYPSYFSWDSAFHALPLAMMDPEFSKKQLILLTREWYMHPNGQIPASEWNFNDVNPPVQAWAAWRVYKIESKHHGRKDRLFLERVFQKLLLNFTWWVNRKDIGGKNVFQGGFLGLDNISAFNRNDPLFEGTQLYQSDATSWMGMYCLNMLKIALELAKENPAYEDMASKFFEHFLYIADAMNLQGDNNISLWCKEDNFYHDVLLHAQGHSEALKVRSMVGIIPLFAVMTVENEDLDRCKDFTRRFQWFLNHREDLCEKVAPMQPSGERGRHLLSIVSPDRLRKILEKVLDEKEFLSPFGIRSLSKFHVDNPYRLEYAHHTSSVSYESGESSTRLFGGNSNWRGPIWFPLNILIIESLQKYHHYLGEEYKVECPTGSGNWMNLWDVSRVIEERLLKLFLKDNEGKRPFNGKENTLQTDPLWSPYILFHEYFDAETGRGLGATHQTGWTALIAKVIQQIGS